MRNPWQSHTISKPTRRIRKVYCCCKQSHCSHETLRSLWSEYGYDLKHFHIVNQKAIRENIRKLSVADGAFWKIYAENQLREYDGDKTSPAAWMEQFNKLGIGYIGKRLLMQIKVIRFDGPTRPFAAKEHEMLGQKVCYCYISDEDPGGSWVSIKDLLTHAHKPGNVAGVVWNSKSGKIQFPE